MKRYVSALALLLAVALLAAGCTAGGKESGSVDGGGSGGSSQDGPVPLTARYIEDLLAGELASEAWNASVTGVGEEIYLRRPVVSIGFKDTDALYEAQMSLQDALVDDQVWGVLELLSADLTAFTSVGDMNAFPAEDLPAVPATGPELAGWFDAAFGSGSSVPEAWAAAVKSTEFAASSDTGFTDVLIVRTDLPYDPEGKRKAEVIRQAIEMAAPTYAKAYAIYFADGGNVLMGELAPGLAVFGY